MRIHAKTDRQEAFLNLPVPQAVAKFAIPTILSQMVTLLYNLADTFFVGHTNDPSQVAALTLSFPLFMSLTMVGNLFGIGANSFISRSLGQGNRENAAKASTFAFYGALGGVLVIMALLYGGGMLAVLWPRCAVREMEERAPGFFRSAVLAALTAFAVASFTGVGTFIYSNF